MLRTVPDLDEKRPYVIPLVRPLPIHPLTNRRSEKSVLNNFNLETMMHYKSIYV
jgi:hypothetical protein